MKADLSLRAPNRGTAVPFYRPIGEGSKMPEDRRWDAVATIEVNGTKAGLLRLDQTAAVTIGRSDRAGLRSPSPRIEMPRELARLRSTKSGWLLENEGTTVGRPPRSVKIEGPDIQARNGARFAPHAWVLLSRGDWTLTWDVGVTVTVLLQPFALNGDAIAVASDQPRPSKVAATVLPETVKLNPSERRNMAALFAYLIRGGPEPKEIYAEAARVLGGAPDARAKNRDLVKAQLPKVAKRINQKRNRSRDGNDLLRSADDIGRYLVELTGTLGQDDLEY